MSASLPVGTVQVLPVHGVPEVVTGADLPALLATALAPLGGLREGDVLVVSSKVVSKALGLREPDGTDREGLVLRHSRRVVAERATPGSGTTRIVEAVAGPVMAAAGLDASNTGPDGGVLVLPEDPDAVARDLHTVLVTEHGIPQQVAVVLSDTAGRPWREGQTDLALGSHGLRVLDDLRGGSDADGRALSVTARALADELAAAADLVKGKLGGVAAAVVRGMGDHLDDGTGPGARSLVRTGPTDWFGLGRVEAVRTALGVLPGTGAAVDVGIPSVRPEDDLVRGGRAVRLALHGQAPGVTVSGSPADGYAVSSEDPVLAGRVAARLEVALAGEQVDVGVAVELAAPSATDDAVPAG
ncbi:coenzyme F420-0:L-glutamate ligase [Ornithinimicrobium pekingense]|uniref:F420-0--gamma-glutamyl ligase n=1 Tax=Ornithinimicrobium pekingense TaxID=384677 RepID=A0ABQ2F7P5_9MICO|nr:coenzyme F420-0:L-glutamate ligase [Ornithinimicrobium pekingense]GGK67066.1 F420-0--gamma-glutamyl ligase [Ornithinimicrobium pekingense]